MLVKKEIRKVVQGKKGMLLASTEYNQKYHIVSRDSRVKPTDFVVADLVKEEEKYAVYRCVSISLDRMVVELVIPQGCGAHGRYYWNSKNNEEVGFIDPDDIREHYEVETWHSSIHLHRGGTLGGQSVLILVRQGSEKDVLKVFVKAQFKHFLGQEMGVCNLLENGPRFQYEKELKISEDFLEAWKKYDHHSFRGLANIFGPWEPGKEGKAPIGTTSTEWDILVPHLAAWSFFASEVEKKMHHFPWGKTSEVIKPYVYSFAYGVRAFEYAAFDHFLEEAAELFKAPSEITRESVLKFLSERKSQFPEVPDSPLA